MFVSAWGVHAFAPRPKATAELRSSRSWAGILDSSRSASVWPARLGHCARASAEHRLLVERVKEIYELQKNVVIVCGEGIVDEAGGELAPKNQPTRRETCCERRLGIAAATSCTAWVTITSATSPRPTSQGGDLYPQNRPHPAGRPPAPLRPFLRGYWVARRPICFWNDKTTRLDAAVERGKDFIRQRETATFRDRWGLIHARLCTPRFTTRSG